MTERELTLFSALTNIGDDLVLESTAFLPTLGGAVGSAVGGTAAAASVGKRAAWVLPVTLASCAALVAAVGILIGVVGNAFGFFPSKPPEVTTEEAVTDIPTEEATEEPTEEPTGEPTGEPTEPDTDTEPETEETTEGLTDALQPSKGLHYGANGEGKCYIKGIGDCTDEIVVIPFEHGGRVVTVIGARAFVSTNIKGVIIPDGVTEIQYQAFYWCEELTSVVIPDGVTVIGENAFALCHNLTSVTIPSSVTSFGDYVFFDCLSLTDIYYEGSEEEWEAIPKPYKWIAGAPVTIHYNCTP